MTRMHRSQLQRPHPKTFSPFKLSIFAVVVITSFLFLENPIASVKKNFTDGTETQNNEISESSIQLTSHLGTGAQRKTLNYLHCGVSFTSENKPSDNEVEIVLLHGAKFTKDNWSESGILDSLCNSTQSHDMKSSVVALDLSVQADGNGFINAIDSLVGERVLSGNPIVVVSPSASGKAIVSLSSSNDEDRLRELIKVWIPVASPSVLSAKDEALSKFRLANIPILAINGNRDVMGKKVTNKLVSIAGAEGLEIDGGHPCYLDSPRSFVNIVLEYLKKNLT